MLSSFAIAQPLFDVLGRNAVFFAVRDSSSREIVLLALALTLVPPALLMAIELAAGIASPRFGDGAHLLFVGALTMLLVIQILKRSEALPASVVLVAAAVLGPGAALLYRRASPVKTFLTVLLPAPVVFVALFLGSSQVSRLVFPEDEPARAAPASAQSRTSVVFVVFDELNLASLMDRNQQIDAKRFPNFASLARNAAWYRSATTVHSHTEVAVPTILAGNVPDDDRLPIAADYPDNLFTLLGGSHRLQVVETLTRLCPRSLCKTPVVEAAESQDDDEAGRAVAGGVRSLVSDVGIVYMHVLLPDRLAEHVPPIDDRWGDFGGGEKTESSAPARSNRPRAILPCARNICRLVGAITADPRPSLYFLHSLLPHVVWTYLPSGRRYTGNVRVIPGTGSGRWRDDEWLTLQGYQRYLLQLAYADRGLGLILRRLRRTGLYDRALVVVTADHGVSFRPDEPRRNLTRANFADIAFVPLLVKLPGQRRPRIVDGFARTTDILPTIADVVRAPLSWQVQGRSLVGARLPLDGRVVVPDQDGHPVSASLSTLLAERRSALEYQIANFGTGPLGRVYRIGPHPRLIGKGLSSLPVEPARTGRVEVDGRSLFGVVDPNAGVVPSYITGQIHGEEIEDIDLAVAVNGTIAATTRSYSRFEETRFAALVPETVLRAGANDVRIFAIRPRGDGVALEELRGSSATFVLRQRGGGEEIESSEGWTVRIAPRVVRGRIGALTRGKSVVLAGWAAEVGAGRAADSVVIFVDGRSVYVASVGLRQGEIFKRHGIGGTGFRAEVPMSVMHSYGQASRVRVFGIRDNVASELEYVGRYLRAGRSARSRD